MFESISNDVSPYEYESLCVWYSLYSLVSLTNDNIEICTDTKQEFDIYDIKSLFICTFFLLVTFTERCDIEMK